MYASITTSASSKPSSSPTRSTTGSLNWARGSSLRASFFISSMACLIPSIPSSSYHGCVVSRKGPGIDLIWSAYCPVVPPAATRDAANQASRSDPDNVELTAHSRAMASQLTTVTAEFAGEWTTAAPTAITANAPGEPTSGTSRRRFWPHSARCDCDQNQSALVIGSSVRFAPIITLPGQWTPSGPSDSRLDHVSDGLGMECLDLRSTWDENGPG